MRVAILGASGGCGRHLVHHAIHRGHAVVIAARPSSRLDIADDIPVHRGDLTSEAFLTNALAGCDAVLCAVGLKLPSLSPFARPEVPDLLTRLAPALIAACKANGIRRVLAISAGGVGDSRDNVPAVFRGFIRFTGLRHAYQELEVFEQELLDSGLEVCIPRPTGLTDEPATGQAIVADAMKGRATIPREDVALWMLGQLDLPSLKHRTPMITVTGASQPA